MEIILVALVLAIAPAAFRHMAPANCHQNGPSVAEIQARLVIETARTYVPVGRGWR